MLTRRSVLCSFTTALALSGTMGASGCFGRFALVNKVYEFNKTGVSEDLVVQEILFLAMIIIPVYGVAAVVDAIVLNPIEVFTGSNPIADASPQESHTITLEEGVVTLIGTDDGLRIERNLSGEVEVFTLRADGMGWILTDGDGEVVGATEAHYFTPIASSTG